MTRRQKNDAPLVVVGMSGGVDSSVTAYLLKEQGFNVVGVYMKNWREEDKGCCGAERDFSDVKRVCEAIDIPYYSIDFSKEYLDKVFTHFLRGLEKGITPNPDVLCNREIKFGPFLDFADKIGAQYLATGHYCRIENGQLLRAKDDSKDQSYFLCALSETQLERVIFPLGELLKTDVRKIAKKLNLVTHDKKDSTGICFIGERNYRNFLEKYLGNKPGDIKNLQGEIVGKHGGLAYYTIGQRKGLRLGGTTENTERWFVVKKDVKSNTLFVNNGDCKELYSKSLLATDFNWLVTPQNNSFACTAKTRYRQPDQDCFVEVLEDSVRVTFAKPVRAVTPGQWVVLYDGDLVLGGGEIIK